MAQVGAGAGRAETRRGWVRTEEEKMKRDREAQWLARVRGVGLVHKGRFFTNKHLCDKLFLIIGDQE